MDETADQELGEDEINKGYATITGKEGLNVFKEFKGMDKKDKDGKYYID